MFVRLKSQFLYFDICSIPGPRNKGGRGISNRVNVTKLVPNTLSVFDILPLPQGDTVHEKRDNALVKHFIIHFPEAITCSPITLIKVWLPTVLSIELVNQPTQSGVSCDWQLAFICIRVVHLLATGTGCIHILQEPYFK